MLLSCWVFQIFPHYKKQYEMGSVGPCFGFKFWLVKVHCALLTIAWQQLLVGIAPDFEARAAIDQEVLILVIDTPYPLWYIYIE